MNPLEFIKHLRRADEATKKRWLIILSAVAMLFVIIIWSRYFAASLVRPGQPEPGEQEFSFWETMGTGLKVVGGKALSAIRGLGGTISGPRNYEIQP